MCFFFAAGSWEKDTKNGAAVMSLRSFLFRDNFSSIITAMLACIAKEYPVYIGHFLLEFLY